MLFSFNSLSVYWGHGSWVGGAQDGHVVGQVRPGALGPEGAEQVGRLGPLLPVLALMSLRCFWR